jgi:fatty acid synthase, animal type
VFKYFSRIFENGVDLDIRAIYPQISFPVARGTPGISHLIRWNHDANHFVPIYDPLTRSDKRDVTISLGNPKYAFLKGHVINGKTQARSKID